LQGEWGINNSDLYRMQSSTEFRFLPWDKDVAFGGNVLIRRLLSGPELMENYLNSLEECAKAAGGAEGWLEAEIERQYKQIRDAAILDSLRPYSSADFEGSVDYLRAFAFDRAEQVSDQVEDARGPLR